MNSVTQSQAKPYGQPSTGCYLDHANYNVDELNRRIIRLAASFGRVDPQDDALAALPLVDLSEDDSEKLNWAADSAIDWLNEQETRPFLYWANEGEANAFGLWPSVESAKEDCGFVSGQSEDADPYDSDYPDADYRGEWLHVNDHGNCTLYVREDLPNGCARGFFDREIWSIA
jgi:hypothetical protein